MNTELSDSPGAFLEGKVLIAMPDMPDPRFARALVYLCSHNVDGAMGFILNKPADSLVWKDLFGTLDIPIGRYNAARQVRYGGPVEVGRGFVVHSSDYQSEEATLRVDPDTSMTASLDILQDIAMGRGPDKAILALGYSGWSPGQLENEIQLNGWLLCDPDDELLFSEENESKWAKALKKIGVDPMLLGVGGHA